jgi:hypothetical protein
VLEELDFYGYFAMSGKSWLLLSEGVDQQLALTYLGPKAPLQKFAGNLQSGDKVAA